MSTSVLLLFEDKGIQFGYLIWTSDPTHDFGIDLSYPILNKFLWSTISWHCFDDFIVLDFLQDLVELNGEAIGSSWKIYAYSHA